MRISLSNGARGFTLIELMIAAAIVCILAAVAYPSFTSHVQRSRRSDAMAALTTVMQTQERYRSNHSTYASALGDEGLGFNAATLAKYYDVSLNPIGTTPSFASGYVAAAQAKPDGPQARDTKCFTMSVKLEGAVFSYLSADAAGNDTTTDSNARCWSR